MGNVREKGTLRGLGKTNVKGNFRKGTWNIYNHNLWDFNGKWGLGNLHRILGISRV